MQDQFNPKSRQHMHCLQCGERTPHAETLVALPCASGLPHTHLHTDWVCSLCGLLFAERAVIPLDKALKHLLITSEGPHQERQPNTIDLPFGRR